VAELMLTWASAMPAASSQAASVSSSFAIIEVSFAGGGCGVEAGGGAAIRGG
jgi:hypothetical protein